jgi:hypothetical protein
MGRPRRGALPPSAAAMPRRGPRRPRRCFPAANEQVMTVGSRPAAVGVAAGAGEAERETRGVPVPGPGGGPAGPRALGPGGGHARAGPGPATAATPFPGPAGSAALPPIRTGRAVLQGGENELRPRSPSPRVCPKKMYVPASVNVPSSVTGGPAGDRRDGTGPERAMRQAGRTDGGKYEAAPILPEAAPILPPFEDLTERGIRLPGCVLRQRVLPAAP